VFVTNHVLAGSIAGSLCRRRPVAAFVVGFGTHVLMDLTPHWGNAELGRDGFFVVARRDGLLGLATVALVTVAGVPPRASLLAGMAGAAFLDADKPADFLLGIQPFPDWLNRFHGRIQRESPDGMRTEIAAGVALAAGAAALLVRARRRARR
jgi:hypothetical protein